MPRWRLDVKSCNADDIFYADFIIIGFDFSVSPLRQDWHA
jgi:hypothetical protein